MEFTNWHISTLVNYFYPAAGKGCRMLCRSYKRQRLFAFYVARRIGRLHQEDYPATAPKYVIVRITAIFLYLSYYTERAMQAIRVAF